MSLGVAGVVLGLYTALVQPNLPPYEFYFQRTNNGGASCSEPDKAKLNPSIENIVAEFDVPAYFEKKIEENISIRASTMFLLRIYNTKSKFNQRFLPRSFREVYEFLKATSFDLVHIYEMNNLHQWHNLPSAIIYISGWAYTKYDLDGPIGLADGNFEKVKCEGKWGPELLMDILQEVIEKRIDDLIKKGGIP